MMRRLAAFALAALAIFLLLLPGCAKPGPCDRNSDCTTGFYCFQGTCKKDCVETARDCDPGYVCNPLVGRCQPADGGTGVPDASGSDASTMDSTMNDAGSDTSTMMDSSSGSKVELDLCNNDGECKSNLICRSLFKNGPQRCTRKCSNNSNCFSGSRCLAIGNETYCAQIDVGRTCNVQNPTACNYACVSPGYCTLECQNGGDCPNGYGCAQIQNKKVCVRAEQYCGNSTCTTLLCDQTGLVDSCTLNCGSSADCPWRALPLAPWTCNGTCKRPADVFGPLAQGDPAEYACSGNSKVVLCNDALHIDFTQFTIPNPPSFNCPTSMSVQGVAGDVCVNSCRFGGGCVHGYACVGVGNIQNQRVGLCLPSLGGGEVGSNCTKDADCAFGYCKTGKCSRDCSADGLCPSGSSCVNGGGPNVENLPFRLCQ